MIFNFKTEHMCEIVECPNFAAITIDWFSLSMTDRRKLASTMMHKELYYEQEWNYLALIIPIDNVSAKPQKAFLFMDEFAFSPEDEYTINEIAKYISDGSCDYGEQCQDIKLSLPDIIQVLAYLTPSIDMTINTGA